LNCAKSYISLLQKYEQAPQEVIEVKEGSEPEEFLKIWFDEEKINSFNRNRFSDITIECNNFYKDVSCRKNLKFIIFIFPFKFFEKIFFIYENI
jgi:hypothetical protein